MSATVATLPTRLAIFAPSVSRNCAVAPEPGKLATRRGLGLRDLVLVMRKDEIDPAAMHVERLAEESHRHRRTLEVPARPPTPPGRIPRGPRRLVLRLRGLPQREILRVLLGVIVLCDACARSESPACRGATASRTRETCRSRSTPTRHLPDTRPRARPTCSLARSSPECSRSRADTAPRPRCGDSRRSE